MPILRRPEMHPTEEPSAGVRRATLADTSALGVPAMDVRRWTLDAGAESEPIGGGDAERFIYLIRGSGLARVGEHEHALAPESLVWLEGGERCVLLAGPEGLEALEASAPGVPG